VKPTINNTYCIFNTASSADGQGPSQVPDIVGYSLEEIGILNAIARGLFPDCGGFDPAVHPGSIPLEVSAPLQGNQIENLFRLLPGVPQLLGLTTVVGIRGEGQGRTAFIDVESVDGLPDEQRGFLFQKKTLHKRRTLWERMMAIFIGPAAPQPSRRRGRGSRRGAEGRGSRRGAAGGVATDQRGRGRVRTPARRMGGRGRRQGRMETSPSVSRGSRRPSQAGPSVGGHPLLRTMGWGQRIPRKSEWLLRQGGSSEIIGNLIASFFVSFNG
jgi:hypothetical protein